MTPPVDERRTLARSTATQTVLTGVSRLTGFVRVVVVAAVLGTTFLGNTYQSANTIPNIVFELFAAGALQAVLVPALVARFDQGDDEGAQRLAGSVLGHTMLALGVFVIVGALTAPWLMELLVSGVEDQGIREDQVALGTIFLLVFLPQVLVYDVGLVATAVLHARGRFGVPAFAPAVNNVVVCSAYGAFWFMRRGQEPSLDLSAAEIAVLAGGTTFGVVAFCTLPVIAARRTGFRIRFSLDRSDPAIRGLARAGLWAAVFLGMTQVLLTAVLVLGNRVEGGIVGYQVAFTFFLLPHSLFSLPVLNTLFPDAARKWQAGDTEGVTVTVERGIRAIAFFVLPVAALFIALAGPIARVALFGEVTAEGSDIVVAAILGFAPGLLGYGVFYFLSRIWYATDDTRTPALVHAAVVVAGVIGMFVAATTFEGVSLVGALAWSHTATYLTGGLVLGLLLLPRLDRTPQVLRLLLVGGAAAVLGGVGAALARVPVGVGGRAGALVELAVGGVVGVAVYLAAQQVLGGTKPANVVRLLRGSNG